MIQEYRKKSAEALGFDTYLKNLDTLWWRSSEHGIIKWQPDKDANQMLMVWEWWSEKERYGYIFDSVYDEILEDDINVLLATMKAFMEYIKSQ